MHLGDQREELEPCFKDNRLTRENAPDERAMCMMLESGRVDAVPCADMVGFWIIKQNHREGRSTAFPRKLGSVGSRFMFSRRWSAFVRLLNHDLAELKKSGELHRILSEHGQDSLKAKHGGTMNSRNIGVCAALASAALFGASTPFAKLLLGASSPWVAAGLLYMGSGLGIFTYRWSIRAPSVHLARPALAWLCGAILAGGIVAPVLLLYGLSRMPASGASLLLNAEGVLTALLAWLVFRENVDRRVATGMLLIAGGTVVLSWPGQASFGAVLPALSVCGACLGWAIDNNLTRKVALADATYIAAAKGLVAGSVNLLLAWLVGAPFPGPATALGAGAVGLLGYGVSLTLFVVALRHLGTARTGAYFSAAPFAGALLAIPLLGEFPTLQTAGAALLMGCGVYLHLTERHIHLHTHDPLEHTHVHAHDEHHAHHHAPPVPGRHAHPHRHERMTHAHPHYPDAHHEHEHR